MGRTPPENGREGKQSLIDYFLKAYDGEILQFHQINCSGFHNADFSGTIPEKMVASSPF